MARPVWTGHISFGLIQIPVRLYSAEKRTDIRFHMLDSRDHARIRYERVNEDTGEEVPWEDVVKAYEWDENNYVVLEEQELEEIKPEATKSIDIEAFVERKQIDCFLYDKPYYLEPTKVGIKSYSLLREVLTESNKAGIARVVIRTRQYLAVVFVREKALVVNLLRFPQELKALEEFDIPHQSLKKLKISDKELEMSKALVDAMTEDWQPENYIDDYRVALQKYVEQKMKQKKPKKKKLPKDSDDSAENIVDITELLKKSLKQRKAG